MSQAQTAPLPLVERARDAVRDVLRSQYAGYPALRLDSPPGAGKTQIVEYVAIQAMARMSERCMIATQTNEQAFDVSRRLARDFPNIAVTLFVVKNIAVPDDVATTPNVVVARSSTEIPTGPCIAIANGARWSWMDSNGVAPFDLLVIDEAFQLADHRFHQIAGMAPRIILIGDPGQIAPFTTCEIDRWRSEPDGPHVPCPIALSERYPELPRMSLPATWRLVPDTVDFVQPAFYRNLNFSAISEPSERALEVPSYGITPMDTVINRAVDGSSLLQVELPRRTTGETDEEIAGTVLALVERLFERRTSVRDGDDTRLLGPEMIGVVCSHSSQVNSIQGRLPRSRAGILVETANRFQGLERPVMIAWHPLSGRADASEFHLDAGRLCVMLSRHRVACFVVARAGIEDTLRRYAPVGNRILGINEDAEFRGWQSHVSLLEAFRQQERIVPVG